MGMAERSRHDDIDAVCVRSIPSPRQARCRLSQHRAVGDQQCLSRDELRGRLQPHERSLVHGGRGPGAGSGKVVFSNEYNTFSGLTVADTAIAAVNPGCKPGAGTVSVGEGATLEVAQSGTATLGGALTLAAGAALAFSFTELETPPVLAGTAVDAGTVNVKVSAPQKGFLGRRLLRSLAGWTSRGRGREARRCAEVGRFGLCAQRRHRASREEGHCRVRAVAADAGVNQPVGRYRRRLRRRTARRRSERNRRDARTA